MWSDFTGNADTQLYNVPAVPPLTMLCPQPVGMYRHVVHDHSVIVQNLPASSYLPASYFVSSACCHSQLSPSPATNTSPLYFLGSIRQPLPSESYYKMKFHCLSRDLWESSAITLCCHESWAVRFGSDTYNPLSSQLGVCVCVCVCVSVSVRVLALMGTFEVVQNKPYFCCSHVTGQICCTTNRLDSHKLQLHINHRVCLHVFSCSYTCTCSSNGCDVD